MDNPTTLRRIVYAICLCAMFLVSVVSIGYLSTWIELPVDSAVDITLRVVAWIFFGVAWLMFVIATSLLILLLLIQVFTLCGNILRQSAWTIESKKTAPQGVPVLMLLENGVIISGTRNPTGLHYIDHYDENVTDVVKWLKVPT